MTRTTFPKQPGEKSFTLLETVIAIGIMATIILHVMGALGNIVYFSGYTRRSTEAMYLAKRLMSQVEYRWGIMDFKALDAKEEDAKFQEDDSDYRYNLEIKDFKLPIFDLMNGDKNATQEEKEEKGQKDGDSGIGSLVQQFLGTDQILKTANVEVTWPEGAKKNSIGLSMLLTNQRAIDAKLVQFEGPANQLKKMATNGGTDAGGVPTGTPGGTPGGGPGGGPSGGPGGGPSGGPGGGPSGGPGGGPGGGPSGGPGGGPGGAPGG